MFSDVLEKDVLYPGTWVLADGRRITVTRGDLANGVRQGNAMLRENIPAPWCWEHDMEAEPAKFSGKNEWFAKGYFGKTLGFCLSQTKLGPCVSMRVGLFDPKDKNQLDRVEKVSPMILWDYVDSSGKTWPGMTIAHVACTPKPIQRNQEKFKAVNSAALSGLSARCSKFAMLGESKPERSNMAKDKEGDGDGDTKGFDKELIDLLGQAGLQLGDGVMTLDDLKGRLKALIASGVTTSAAADQDDGTGLPGDGTGPAGVGPMVMSGLPEAVVKSVAGILDAKRTELINRVGTLFDSGRINKPIADGLKNRIKAAVLSLGNDGQIYRNELLTEVAAYEKLPASATWQKTEKDKKPANLSDFREVPKPEIAGDDEKAVAARNKERDEWMLGPLAHLRTKAS